VEAGRLNAYEAAPEAMRAVQRVEGYIQQCGLEKSLIELVKMRASQINGCAYCLHVHSKDTRRAGETEQRLYLLDAWHESSLYTDRERAALAWTEALTRVAETHAPDAIYDEVRRHFHDKELVDLTTLIGLINLWNRLAIGFRYQHPVGKPGESRRGPVTETVGAREAGADEAAGGAAGAKPRGEVGLGAGAVFALSPGQPVVEAERSSFINIRRIGG
jgi:AhpD family alkylhydroperoxidase